MAHQDFERYANEKHFSHGASSSWAAAFNEFVPLASDSSGNIRFLDYGCGDGKYFQYLRDLGLKTECIHGVELSRTRIERCHRIGFVNAIHLEKGERLPYPDNAFDVVNLMEVIEHVPRPQAPAMLTEIKRVLAPTGFLLISTPNYPIKRVYDISDAVLHRKWARLRDDPTHISPYSYWGIRSLLGNYFEVVAERPYKLGFLYHRLKHPLFLHKSFFVCHNMPNCKIGQV